MMTIDMTAQLAPLVWGLVTLLVVSAVSVFAAAMAGKAARRRVRSRAHVVTLTSATTLPESSLRRAA